MEIQPHNVFDYAYRIRADWQLTMLLFIRVTSSTQCLICFLVLAFVIFRRLAIHWKLVHLEHFYFKGCILTWFWENAQSWIAQLWLNAKYWVTLYSYSVVKELIIALVIAAYAQSSERIKRWSLRKCDEILFVIKMLSWTWRLKLDKFLVYKFSVILSRIICWYNTGRVTYRFHSRRWLNTWLQKEAAVAWRCRWCSNTFRFLNQE